jgi:putative heme-binding domain-containing protein
MMIDLRPVAKLPRVVLRRFIWHGLWLVVVLCQNLVHAARTTAAAEPLERQLLSEGAASLVAAARRQGDAQRGAVLFHQRNVGCALCHLPDDGRPGVGPDLTRPPADVNDIYLVASVLQPSKHIRKGYETIQVVTDDGRTITGLLAEDLPDAIVLRSTEGDFERKRIDKQAIDEREVSTLSAMPAGLVNQLAGREQFLDLLRYLLEISEFGPQRVAQLRPPPGLFSSPPLPEYERHVDHAGLLAEANDAGFKRGEAIYHRVCANCHGTAEHAGSLPNALKFASGSFKNGVDPLSIYRTLTFGFGLMAPQSWMVPREKYDVIHYLREAFLKPRNPSQYVTIDAAYLASLPKGDTRGPEPTTHQPWVATDYGNSLTNTYEVGSDGSNFAYKGIAVRLDPGPGGVSRGRDWMVFDHDTLRVAAVWSRQDDRDPGFIDYNGIHFNGRHQVHPRIVGRLHLENRQVGWADPQSGLFEDVRLLGRDGNRYGPLPRTWGHFNGSYHNQGRVIFSYSVGQTSILEMPSIAGDVEETPLVFARSFYIGPRANDLTLQVAEHPDHHARLRMVERDALPGARHAFLEPDPSPAPDGDDAAITNSAGTAERRSVIVAGLSPDPSDAQWCDREGQLRLRIAAGEKPLNFTLWTRDADKGVAVDDPNLPPIDLNALRQGGARRWPEVLRTEAALGTEEGPFAIDVLSHPAENPWSCQMRLTGFDFLDDGQAAAVCTWDGDVWLVRGVDRPEEGITWQRIAAGLFQPLGLKVHDGKIYVGCRDQIVVLHDLNSDGETDYYENFNSDHQVTEHFHEFAMGLQADADGNFYYAKSARHALPAVVPHHGTLLRVGHDGRRTDILATGFRAANGVCLNADGTFFVTDQEGHWTPKNRINWVEVGGFYGNMFGYHDVTDASDSRMRQPLCWITNSFDRSPGELLWVTSEAWGPLKGSLLELSYGAGKIFIVPHEKVDGQLQGGMCALPLPIFPTGVMRGRFHPTNGQLYACGMFAWAGNQTAAGGFYRVRYTGKTVCVPLSLHAQPGGMEVVFSAPLDRDIATDPKRYSVRAWSLKRTENYGSDHYDEHELTVASASLGSDRCSVFIALPEIAPTWCMAIDYRLKAADATPVVGQINNTIHRLGPAND